MLILSRKNNQEIHLPELNVRLKVLEVKRNRIRVGVEAPHTVRVLRGELVESDFASDCGASDCGASDCGASDYEAFDCEPMAMTPDTDREGYVWPLGVVFMPQHDDHLVACA